MNHRRLLACISLIAACASFGANAIAADCAAFAEVEATARRAFEQQHPPGMALSIWDASGVKLFEKSYGQISADQRIPIASASKLVAGLTILRLVDQGRLSLDSTTGQVLGWKGPQAA